MLQPMGCKWASSLIFKWVNSSISKVALPQPAPPLALVATLGVLCRVAKPGPLLFIPGHLAMKQYATWANPRYDFPPFLAAVGHNTVRSPNTEGSFPWIYQWPETR